MFIIRPIKIEDYSVCESIAKEKSSLGLTSLPHNPKKILEKIENCIASLDKDVMVPDQESYLFVLENHVTGEKAGMCGIYATAKPAYFYRLLYEEITSKTFHFHQQIPYLEVVKYPKGPTEIGSLYLFSEYRREGLGKLLSYCRFLFIASHQERFQTTITAVIRGVNHRDLHAPFWDHVGKQFLNKEFKELEEHLVEDTSILEEILPKHPLYLSFIPKAALDVMGKTHEKATPAYQMLLKEGFKPTQEYDVIDGGPRLIAQTTEVEAIRLSKTQKTSIIKKSFINPKKVIISNEKLDFRACYAEIEEHENQVYITQDIAEALNLAEGESVRRVYLT